MRYPPDEWRILPEDGFATHVIENAEQALTADVLLQVGRSAKLEGCFKIQLGGSEILHADFPAKNALVMGGAASFKLVLERWPRDINIRVNTTTSEWFDLEER